MSMIDGDWCIRANQGHSILNVDNSGLERLTNDILPKVCLHGTNRPALAMILATGGLSVMKRKHVHLASGKLGDDGVISGSFSVQFSYRYTSTIQCFHIH